MAENGNGGENGNGRNKILWWLINLLLGIATTTLWITYFDTQNKIDTLNRQMDGYNLIINSDLQRIRALEVEVDILQRQQERR